MMLRILLALAIAAGLFFGLRDAHAGQVYCAPIEYLVITPEDVALWEPGEEALKAMEPLNDACVDSPKGPCLTGIAFDVIIGEFHLRCEEPIPPT